LATFCGDCADRIHLAGWESEPNGLRAPGARPILTSTEVSLRAERPVRNRGSG